MKTVILSLFTGVFAGFLFSMLKLPIPAPATFAGVMGIVGLFLGFLMGKIIRAKIF
ncbi:MAG: XapX domain-containing protein [Clostridia bacterium]|nr:XapX domain-containing protein [Clostridia bacterium]